MLVTPSLEHQGVQDALEWLEGEPQGHKNAYADPNTSDACERADRTFRLLSAGTLEALQSSLGLPVEEVRLPRLWHDVDVVSLDSDAYALSWSRAAKVALLCALTDDVECNSDRAEALAGTWKYPRVHWTRTDLKYLEDVLRSDREHGEQQRVIDRLQDAAEAGDEQAFLEALEGKSRRYWTAADFVAATRLALEAGAHSTAGQLSSEGVQRYPTDASIRKYARLLAPPRVIPSEPRPDRAQRQANRQWLKLHSNEHRGQWVAIRNGDLLESGDSLEELVRRVGDAKDVLLTKAV